MAERSFEIARRPGFRAVALTAFVLLSLPIITLVVYSFNAGQSVLVWEGFSLDWYSTAWANDAVQGAAGRDGPDAGNRRRRSLCKPLAGVPTCHPAPDAAGDHCGGDAGLCDQP